MSDKNDSKLPNIPGGEGPKDPRVNAITAILLLAVLGYLVFGMGSNPFAASGVDTLATSDFVAAVKDDRVKDVTFKYADGSLTGTYWANGSDKDSSSALKSFKSVYVGADSLAELMADHPGTTYRIDTSSDEVLQTLLFSVLPTVIMLVVFIYFMRRMGNQNGQAMSFGKTKALTAEGERPKVKFSDVAGIDEAVEELQEVRDFLSEPERYRKMGAKIPHGVLLVGPPGTGKTLLAKAVAGEAGVPFFSISGSDFVEMFVGVGASRVRDLFDQAKRAAPSIIFIDEIDAVGRHRGAGLGGGHDEREQTLNQLLVEMDGFAINEGVIVMAATNRRDILDPALLRPGRFDRTILVNYPDMAGRVAILKVHAKGKPLADDVDLENIAKRVPFSTGAELENIMNEAAILAARGRLKAINQQTLVEAISRVQMGPEKRSHKVTQRDKRMVAIHEAGHAIVGHVLPNCDEVHLITIVPRGQAGGYTLSLPTEEDDLQTYSQLMDFVAMGLGGHAAEQLYLGEFTTGATSDLKKATEVCRRMVTQFGMSEKLGPVYLDGDQEVFVGMEFGQSRGYSEEMAARIDAEVKRLLEECYQKAVDALSANRDRMEKLVDALLKYDTISRREFVTLMETGALPDIQDADTRTTGAVMMQDMADEKKEENSEKSAETPEKSAEAPEKTADAPENHPDAPHEA